MNKSGKKYETRHDELQPEKREFEHTGQYLQKLRTDKGLTIKDVSNATRISEVNLNAIEAQEFQTLPADTFTRGFLTLYAKFLGVDPARIVQQFMNERDSGKSGNKRLRTARHSRNLLTPKTLAEPSHFSSMTAAIILLIVIVFLFTAFCLYTSWNPFSFMMSDKKNIESIMMGLEQSFPYNSPENKEKSSPDKEDKGLEGASPQSDRLDNTQSSSGEKIERNTGIQESGSFLPTGAGGPLFIAGGQQSVPTEKMKDPNVLSLSKGLPNQQGDD